jgi:hypothetical protein
VGSNDGRLLGYLGSIFLRQVWMQMSETCKTTEELHRVQDAEERGLTDAEISTFKRCLAQSGDPKKGEGTIARIEDGRLCIRPRSIPNFRKVMADRGLGEHVILMGVMKWLEQDMNRWLRFGYE